MYCFYNANPLGRRVNDCTVRAISAAYGIPWDDAFDELALLAKAEGTMLDDIDYIDDYLQDRFNRVYSKGETKSNISVRQFVNNHPIGIYLITMRGHITCCIDGCIYDTFNPEDRIVWDAYKIN